MSPAVQVLLSAAAVATAVGVLWRFLHLTEILRGTRLFLLDWLGQPARPGAEAVPSFPERMAQVEKRTADLSHDFRGELTSRLTLLAYTVDRTHEQLSATTEHLARLEVHQELVDQRITDHRRRNDEQIALLREAVARVELAQAALPRRHTDDRPGDSP